MYVNGAFIPDSWALTEGDILREPIAYKMYFSVESTYLQFILRGLISDLIIGL